MVTKVNIEASNPKTFATFTKIPHDDLHLQSFTSYIQSSKFQV